MSTEDKTEMSFEEVEKLMRQTPLQFMPNPPKPIVVVYLPETINDGGMKINWKMCGDISESIEISKPDYHWFFFPDHRLTTPEIKVFYQKDFTPIQYEELKKMIEEKIKVV